MPGYDAATGSLYRPAFELPAVSERPTREEVRAAAEKLLELACDFPFEQEVHRSAWLAALLTPLARWAFRGQRPLFLIDANQPGSGKGLLLKVIGWLVQGREMDVVLQTEDEDEERKRITSKLLGGAKLKYLCMFRSGSQPSLASDRAWRAGGPKIMAMHLSHRASNIAEALRDEGHAEGRRAPLKRQRGPCAQVSTSGMDRA